jgi:selenocysteine lyase/cysteine desulfurase
VEKAEARISRMTSDDQIDFEFLRRQTVGIDAAITTPFGARLMTYCDYTASGRCLAFVESYLMQLQRTYANTHTEDDVSGRSMTQILHAAEEQIKKSVHAGPHGRLIAIGAGSTAAIDKLQQILGVQIPPATRALMAEALRIERGDAYLQDYERALIDRRPVVFVGPYEHHSNEVTWRQGFAEVLEVRLDQDGGTDLAHLEELLTDPRYQDRLRIGSFSAASNVTGIKSRVQDIARLLHRHGAMVCFDYAASAPYVEIDMNPDPGPEGGDPSIDAVFISPHKFLGGPGSSGILVFHERLYQRQLPPSVGGGGTVDYVGPQGQDYIEDIEQREKAGTPGVLQTMKAALAFGVKDAIGTKAIEARENELLVRAFDRWKKLPAIHILGNQDPARRIGIVSFNIRTSEGDWIHPRLLTVLLNDLFGIQSRAGCSCAGPYGHRLLNIDIARAERFRHWVLEGFQGIKPGWCRLGFHYVMDDAEANFIIDAVEFLAEHGQSFVSLYDFDAHTGVWAHSSEQPIDEAFSLDAALRARRTDPEPLPAAIRQDLYTRWLTEARKVARELETRPKRTPKKLEGEVGELQFFRM